MLMHSFIYFALLCGSDSSVRKDDVPGLGESTQIFTVKCDVTSFWSMFLSRVFLSNVVYALTQNLAAFVNKHFSLLNAFDWIPEHWYGCFMTVLEEDLLTCSFSQAGNRRSVFDLCMVFFSREDKFFILLIITLRISIYWSLQMYMN